MSKRGIPRVLRRSFWTGAKREQLELIESFQKGDVLRINNKLRVVRAVYHTNTMTSVVLAIMRCSWTHAAYTSYGLHDLMRMKIERIGRNYVHKTQLERDLDEDIHRSSSIGRKDDKLKCCDVIGVLT